MSETLNLKITGMTCGKCERLIKEGALEVTGVTEVEVDRPGGTAKIQISKTPEIEQKKEQILNIINALVNGKFNSTFIEG